MVLGAGWVVLVINQARQISELQALTGSTDSAVAAQWASTRRRIVGESAVFLLLLLAVSALLAWLYWRESRRARAMQAFFAAVTHELRTPLTSMRLQAEAIAEGDQRVELARRLLEDSQPPRIADRQDPGAGAHRGRRAARRAVGAAARLARAHCCRASPPRTASGSSCACSWMTRCRRSWPTPRRCR